ADIHTLNIPMAADGGVTAGLISKAQYDSFAAKLPLAGGTLTGDLNLGSNNLTASSINTGGNIKGSILTATTGINIQGGGAGSMQLRYPNTADNRTITFPST